MGGFDELGVEAAEGFGGGFGGDEADVFLVERVGVVAGERLLDENEVKDEVESEHEQRGDSREVQVHGREQGAGALGEARSVALERGAIGRRNDVGRAHRVPPWGFWGLGGGQLGWAGPW